MNRSTVYYHFESRDALLGEVKQWVGQRLSDLLMGEGNPAQKLSQVVAYVLTYPDVVALWVMDLVSGAPVRVNFPYWDLLLNALRHGPAVFNPIGAEGDAGPPETEVWASVMLAVTLMAPRLYKFAVRPEEDLSSIAQRFATVYDWMFKALNDAPVAA